MAVLKYPVPAAELRAAVLQALEQCEARAGAAAPPAAYGPAADRGLPGGRHRCAAAAVIGRTAPQVAGPDADADGRVVRDAILARRPASDGPDGLATVAGAVGPARGPGRARRRRSGPIRLEPLVRELGLIGNDPSWRQVIELAATIAASRSPVLIAGEPGTGKSQLARLIHALGHRARPPVHRLRGRSLADEIARDEADEPDAVPTPPPVDSALVWAAKLNLARGGTLYIDDVAALPVPRCSSTCSATCSSATTRRPPATPRPPGEVRFVMSTSENLPALIEQGRFRQELYHRISVVMLTPPPLRHRGTDIELLAESFRDRYAQEFHKNVSGFTRDALDILQRHDWPGNVRELEAAIQRAVAMCNGPRISSSHLAPILNHHRQSRGAAGTPRPHLPMGIRPLKEALEEPEKRIIIQALQAFNWNRQETARVLDINRTTLYKKINRYKILTDTIMSSV